jgi:hypothetical protein
MVLPSHHTPATIGRGLANKPNPITPAPRARIIPLPTRRHRNISLRSPPLVMVRAFSLWNREHSGTYRLLTVPLDYWRGNQEGPSTGTFHMVSPRVRLSSCNPVDAFPQGNAHTYHQPSAGPTRTGLMSMGRFQPYGMSRARLGKHENARAGPSTLVPRHVPYVGLPVLQPSGGISETTAYAEPTHFITEEDKVAVSHFYCSHIPRVTEWLFGVRRPSGPGAPAVKDHLACTACSRRATPRSYATGRRGSRRTRGI